MTHWMKRKRGALWSDRPPVSDWPGSSGAGSWERGDRGEEQEAAVGPGSSGDPGGAFRSVVSPAGAACQEWPLLMSLIEGIITETSALSHLYVDWLVPPPPMSLKGDFTAASSPAWSPV